MNDRDRLVNCLLGEPVDRPPFLLYFNPWPSTWARWEREGKPDSVKDARSIFDPDMPPLPLPVNCGPCPRFEDRTVEETDECRVFYDNWGIKQRMFKGKESMPQFLEFPIKTRRDWEQFKEERLDPDHPDRVTEESFDAGETWNACGLPVQLGYYPDTTIYGGVRWLLGDEECLVAFCTMPDLIHDIMEHLTNVYLTVFEKVVTRVRVDLIHIWEDMCGRQGPLISPQQWEEFMGPHYRRVHAFARAHDIPLMSVDTDGRADLIVPPMMRAGVNFLWPLEVAAGCDANAYRKEFPELGIMGGVDKRALALGKAAIDAELERLRPAMESGRYIPELDHCVPDDVSWENWCYYAEQLKRFVGKA